MTQNLSTKAVLVSLKQSRWTGYISDKEIAQDAASQRRMDAKKLRVTKKLIDHDSFNAITTAYSDMRKYHTDHTLLWSRGTQILLKSKYVEYSRVMREKQARCESACSEFLPLYPALIQVAKNELNGGFKDSDFPTPESLPNKFHTEWAFQPWPTVNDFRINLSSGDLETARQAWEAKISEAMVDLYGRILGTVQALREKMDILIGENGAGFHKSLFTNIEYICDIAPTLNLTGDIRLEGICADIKSALIIHPDAPRENAQVRAQLADKAQEMENILTGYMG